MQIMSLIFAKLRVQIVALTRGSTGLNSLDKRILSESATTRMNHLSQTLIVLLFCPSRCGSSCVVAALLKLFVIVPGANLPGPFSGVKMLQHGRKALITPPFHTTSDLHCNLDND